MSESRELPKCIAAEDLYTQRVRLKKASLPEKVFWHHGDVLSEPGNLHNNETREGITPPLAGSQALEWVEEMPPVWNRPM